MPQDYSYSKKLRFEKLEIKHLEGNTFKSTDRSLEHFFYKKAFDNQKESLGLTEVAVYECCVAGFITVCSDSIELNEDEIKKCIPEKTPSYKTYGAVLIGRLDTHTDHRKKGVAKLLVGRQILKTAENNLKGIAPARFITVDSYTNSVNFYKSLGFQESTQESKQREYRDQDTKKLYFDIFDKNASINAFMEEYAKQMISD